MQIGLAREDALESSLRCSVHRARDRCEVCDRAEREHAQRGLHRSAAAVRRDVGARRGRGRDGVVRGTAIAVVAARDRGGSGVGGHEQRRRGAAGIREVGRGARVDGDARAALVLARGRSARDTELAIAEPERDQRTVRRAADREPEASGAELVVDDRHEILAADLAGELVELRALLGRWERERSGADRRAVLGLPHTQEVLLDRIGLRAHLERAREPAGTIARARVPRDEVGRELHRRAPEQGLAGGLAIERLLGVRDAADHAIDPLLRRAARVDAAIVERGRLGQARAVGEQVLLDREARPARRLEHLERRLVVAARPERRHRRDQVEQRTRHGMYSTPIDGKIGSPLV